MKNPFDIKDKIVLVTGGTRGLGKAISLHFGLQGARVWAGYFQDEQAAGQFRNETDSLGVFCSTIKANLLTASGIQILCDKVLEETGRVDTLIYNSATGVHKPLLDLSSRQFSIVWQVNVGAFLDLALKLRSSMPPGSKILAISSEGARRAVKSYGAIGSSKAALEALCRQMAVEWAGYGISVNMVAPGLLCTDTMKIWEDADNRVKQETSSSPLGRLISLEEVACLVHFLCSKASSGIVGQTIVIDGGKSISSL